MGVVGLLPAVCPEELSPQQRTVPSFIRAQMCTQPAETSATRGAAIPVGPVGASADVPASVAAVLASLVGTSVEPPAPASPGPDRGVPSGAPGTMVPLPVFVASFVLQPAPDAASTPSDRPRTTCKFSDFRIVRPLSVKRGA